MAGLSLPAAATAYGLSAALSPIAGSSPMVSDMGGYFDVTFTPDQEDRIAEWIRAQLNKEPGAVRVDAGGIALKVLIRQYWPWIVGAVALGAAVGYTAKRRR